MSAAREPRAWRPAAALVALKLAIGGLVLFTGFRAVSDDDFARVVIAQRFAESPALDPSGTSWLPLPFWIYGAALRVAGSTLDVARLTALVLGALGVVLIWRAAFVLGWSRRAAFLSAALAAVFPYSAYLGAAVVPELPAAALVLFGAAALTGGIRVRTLGALALGAACASRYEAWAVALAFSIITGWEAARTRSVALASAGLLALAFPALWLLHGWVRHDDALFFVARVSAYRAALGLEPLTAGTALLRGPAALVTREPELAFGALVSIAALGRRGIRLPPGVGRALLALGALLLLAVAGDLRGSAPTHHEERALLALWLGAALLIGFALDRFLLVGTSRSRAVLTAVGGAVLALGLALRHALPREPFTERTDELAIGLAARAAAVERLVIDSPDYGFFAVQAAFGAPSRTRVLDDHDPRKAHRSDPLRDPETFLREHTNAGFRWVALPKARLACCPSLGAPRAEAGSWLLLELAARTNR